MLKYVLKEIDSGQIFSKASIGKHLNISVDMVDDLVNQLIKMGYVMEDLGSPTCQHKCSGCSISSCNTIPIKMYWVTDKGKKYLNS